jgi:phosphatidylglycerol:prolipoprotein diacylglycerol transferase
MLVHPQFDPIALQLGPIAIRWYGLMYLIAFALVWLLGRWRIAKGNALLTARDLDDLLFYGILGVVLGGRLGYVLFYKPGYYLSHPVEMLYVWQGGMAFHGGLIGVLLVLWLFARSRGLKFLEVGDFIAPLIPLGLAAGRMGNFINGELWGRATDVSWGMVFPQAGDTVVRHPSQLYQFAGEGVLLFLIVWIYSAKPRAVGKVSGVFLTGYGVFRFLAEFAREPDNFLGFLPGGLTMGQYLSLPMIVIGIAMFMVAKGEPMDARALAARRGQVKAADRT